MKLSLSSKNSGFTIIELLVIIVVIGILAGIGIFAYAGVQRNARDSSRLANVETISQAIELYTRDNEAFPAAVTLGQEWEQSSVRGEDFLEILYTDNYLRGTRLTDPTNTSDYEYRYRVYDPLVSGQTNHCATDRGPYFVLGISQLESLGMSGSEPVASPESPGWSCEDGGGSRNWQTEFAWVTGGYLDEYTTTTP